MAADKEEIVDIVDGNNNVIGSERRRIAHERGLLHRASHVFIFNSSGELLIQRRSHEKSICPGKLDFSAAEHLEQGESYLDGAVRGVTEELSIKAELEELRGPRRQTSFHPNGLVDNEFVSLFRGYHDGPVSFDREEVEEVMFVPVEKVKEMVKEDPKQFSDWFVLEWKWLDDNGFV